MKIVIIEGGRETHISSIANDITKKTLIVFKACKSLLSHEPLFFIEFLRCLRFIGKIYI